MKPIVIATGLVLAAGAAAADGPRLASQVPGIAVLRLADLPAAPAPTGERQYCSHFFIDPPETEAGRATRARGWEVTGEVPLGPWTAVSFVGDYLPSTSGTCDLLHGNIGLFLDAKLVGLVYSSDPEAQAIGQAVAFGPSGLRIWDGSILPQPVADLRLIGGTDVAVTPPALEEPVCGSASVPYLYGLPIDMARGLLAEYGWQPVPQPQATSGMAQEIAAAGVTEVEDCAGTGFGFCSFAYEGPAGSLSVVTAGEPTDDHGLPAVVGHSAQCAVQQPPGNGLDLPSAAE